MELEKELKAVETAVESEVVKVEDAVVKVAEEVKTEVKAALVALTGDEKFLLRDTELEYLKAQMEIQRLTRVAEAKGLEYRNAVDSFLKKYALDKAEYIFDGAKLAFTKIEKAL